MFDRFTDRARKVMEVATAAARGFPHVTPAHVLVGVLKTVPVGVASSALTRLGVDTSLLRLTAERHLPPRVEGFGGAGQLPLADATRLLLDRAAAEARNLNHNYVGSEHLLMGCAGDPELGPVLWAFGVTVVALRAAVLGVMGQGQ